MSAVSTHLHRVLIIRTKWNLSSGANSIPRDIEGKSQKNNALAANKAGANATVRSLDRLEP